MCIKKVVKKVIAIIHGNYNRIFHLYSNEVRLNICKKCPELKHNKVLGDICGVCGCIVEAKVTIPEEHCKLNKW
ncbi:MAG: hypothetical protein Nk1A_8860 [Endomicrobiia bacterium]|nr:MAG: hypothetical protein Nk1A_8860 [Endomicrobiia bacterium]